MKTIRHIKRSENESFVSSGMKYIKGQNRSQTTLFPVSLDDAVDAGNEVRIIDLFVDSLKLEEFGFRVDHTENGRPAYHPSDLLKLYIYGYLAGIFSFLFAKIARFKLILSHLKQIIERIMKEPKITNRDVNNRILIQNIIVNGSF